MTTKWTARDCTEKDADWSNWGIWDSEGCAVATFSSSVANNGANAKLACAAPELLRHAAIAAEILRGLTMDAADREVLRNLDAAIAKAGPTECPACGSAAPLRADGSCVDCRATKKTQAALGGR